MTPDLSKIMQLLGPSISEFFVKCLLTTESVSGSVLWNVERVKSGCLESPEVSALHGYKPALEWQEYVTSVLHSFQALGNNTYTWSYLACGMK